MTDNEIKKALECKKEEIICAVADENKATHFVYNEDALDLINRLQAENEKKDRAFEKLIEVSRLWKEKYNTAKAEVERLKTIAKKMHTWIFLNSCDEEKAYAECGLTDEENALLGYCGKIVFENKEKVGDKE